jgi:Calx-beta domain
MRSRTMSAIYPAAGWPRRRPGLLARALILAMTWIGAGEAVRADTIVVKGGALVEGAVVQATRNTLIVRRSMGGMHQMSMRDIEEVRVDLAGGRQVSGALLSWTDGVFEIRTGGEVIRAGAGRILSRTPAEPEAATAPSPPPRPQPAATASAPRQEPVKTAAASDIQLAARTPPAREPADTPTASRDQAVKQPGQEPVTTAPVRDRSVKMAAAPRVEPAKATTHAQPGVKTAAAPPKAPVQTAISRPQPANAAAAPGAEPMQPAAAAPGKAPTKAATVSRDKPVKTAGQRPAVQSSGVGEATNSVGPGTQVAEIAAPQGAESDHPLALNASVQAAEAGDGMLFNIALSRAAEQTIVLIYGTVDGTARAGTDYEPRQGVLTLAPGSTETQVSVPLIAGREPRDEARFELFLTADPKVVQIAEPRVIATLPAGR